jgi:hypothetical protein
MDSSFWVFFVLMLMSFWVFFVLMLMWNGDGILRLIKYAIDRHHGMPYKETLADEEEEYEEEEED